MESDSTKKSFGEFQENVKNVARQKMADVQRNLNEKYGQTRENVVTGAKVTDQYVRDNPWAVIGGAVAIGFLFGLLVNPRR